MSHVFLIYVSKRTDPNDAMLVRDIAIEASQTNRGMGISGILMAVGDHFLQVLEGHAEAVNRLLDKISGDQRHRDVKVLYQGTLPDRIFGQWSMGCVQSNTAMVQSDAHFEAIRGKIEELSKDLTQEKGEKLRDLIVRIPTLLADDMVRIE